MAAFGAAYTGPSAHFWQKFMEWLFSGKVDVGTVLVKVAVDQLSYGPVCNGAWQGAGAGGAGVACCG